MSDVLVRSMPSQPTSPRPTFIKDWAESPLKVRKIRNQKASSGLSRKDSFDRGQLTPQEPGTENRRPKISEQWNSFLVLPTLKDRPHSQREPDPSPPFSAFRKRQKRKDGDINSRSPLKTKPTTALEVGFEVTPAPLRTGSHQTLKRKVALMLGGRQGAEKTGVRKPINSLANGSRKLSISSIKSGLSRASSVRSIQSQDTGWATASVASGDMLKLRRSLDRYNPISDPSHTVPPMHQPLNYAPNSLDDVPAGLKRTETCCPSLSVSTFTNLDSLPVSKERTAWFGVQISAPTYMTPSSVSGQDIDVALIIDNSYSSPWALDVACELTGLIASFLNRNGDRIAILSTACSHQNDGHPACLGCEVSALDVPQLGLIEKAIRYLKSRHSPSASRLTDIVNNVLCSMFGQSETPDMILRPRETLLFVISPYSTECVDIVPASSHVSIYMIVPAACQQKGSMTQNIWIIPPPISTGLGNILMDLTTTRTLIDGLRAVVAQARGIYQIPVFRNIELRIEPRSSCTIERYLHSHKDCLLPGQTLTFFVQATIPAAQLPPSEDMQTRRSCRRLQNAFHDLELLLGIVETECFSLRINYSHPLLPYDSIVTMRQIIRIPRPNPSSPWNFRTLRPDEESTEPHFETSLAAFIACYHGPTRALSLLDLLLPCSRMRDMATKSMIQRIRHQLLQERHLHMLRSQHLATADTPSKHVPTPLPIYHHLLIDRTLSASEPEAGTQAAAETPPSHHLRLRSLSDPAATIMPHGSSVQPIQNKPALSPDHADNIETPLAHTVDEAQLIWRHMRRTSRSVPTTPANGPRMSRPKHQRAAHTVMTGWPADLNIASGLNRGLASSAGSSINTLDASRNPCLGDDVHDPAENQRDEVNEDEEKTMRHIRAEALKNKRSVGADTLRSLAMATCATSRGGNEFDGEDGGDIPTGSMAGFMGPWI